MYYIGIDGGGTKTTFTIINEEGFKIDKLIYGTSHYEQIGFDGVEKILKNGIYNLLQQNDIQRDEIESVFLGLPGYGEVKSVKLRLDKIVKNILNNINFAIGNDVEVGFEGSLAGNCGINIVSGTGSIALGKDLNGKTVRCGGWGDYIGDEGSAHWIGKKTLEVFSKEADHRLDKGDLYYHIRDVLNINDDFEIIDYALNKIKKDRTKIAEFSSLCYDSAIRGDKNAIRIFNEAAYELSLLVKMIINELNFDDEILVSYSGGVFKSNQLILNPLKENLSEYNIKFIEPILEPSEGSCLLAYKLKNSNISNELINNLRKNIQKVKI
ncbi:N-acetylmuramic acid/N-acetylglucosamine kinase [bioreactor metagenome]|uniref:N-acetylmuramic acid/N-acetylglucosamine kinase n=1 Tax=bioreactor metagenome TaxID=1076179 RepID=A0A645A4C9_9ZZZZ|nr:BadF/BadG/BcrA/BcrD ATPase family protein [Romboutsia lituseburensis]